VEAALTEDDGPRTVPRQVVPQSELVDQANSVVVTPKEVVIELLEPRTARATGLEAGRQPSRDGFTLEDRNEGSALDEP
jgi:hypothetical protein